MRLRRKITVAFFLVSALVSLLLALFLYRFVERQLRTELRSRLRNIATLGARTVDPSAYARLRAQVAELEPDAVRAVERAPGGDYQRLSDQLNAIRAAEPGLIRYVYVLVPTADPDQPRFVVDADVLAGAPDDPELSHFAQPYDVSDVPLLKRALLECTPQMESTFVYDPAFKVHSVSAYVPLPGPRDGSGRCPGVIGVDITDTDMRAALGRAGSLAIKVSLAVIALALVVSIIMGTMLTRSVIALSDAVKRFADKDFAVRTRVASKDEIGQLGASFNAMAETIQHHSDNLESLVRHRTSELEAEKQTSDRLLLNVLPAPIATRLKQGEGVIVDRFDDVTVLFADIVGFTALSARTSPEVLVAMLDDLFTRFDALADRHGLEKIKTIGDAYMVVAGVPEKTPDHATRMARMGLDMLATLADYATTNTLELTIRIGIHSGPVVAGVIGRNKFIYDLWGDTVNTASRMESHGLPSRVHVSGTTVAALGAQFEVEARGEIDVKGKGPMATFFLVRERDRDAEAAPTPTRATPTDSFGATVARASAAPGGAPGTTWTVTLPHSSTVVASFTREGLGHKFKKIVKKELQTGDKAFDDAVFIATDTADETAALLAAADVRAAIAGLVIAGGTVSIDARRMIIDVAGAGSDDDDARVATLTRALVGG
ncbi:MAG: HAMP domain-containing protein [Myxococcales bacterium]|nr:HAMP domain-containing protein [Myxococcales bacterium]